MSPAIRNPIAPTSHAIKFNESNSATVEIALSVLPHYEERFRSFLFRKFLAFSLNQLQFELRGFQHGGFF